MKPSFIHPELGKNSHLRYFSSFLLILLFLIVIGGFMYIFSILITDSINPKIVDLEELRLKDSLVDLFLSPITNVFWILGIWISTKTIHKRSLISFITPYQKINWKRVFFGFIVFFALLSIGQIVDFILFPEDYKWNDFDPSRFIWLLVAAIFLVPIQTTSEELFFRGFLLQWIGKLIKQPILLAMIVGLIFAALHFGNPEMSIGALWVGLDYIFTGFIWTYIAIRTNSAELTIGAHAANNMFLCIFLTYENSLFENLPSLFVLTDVNGMISTIYSIITSTLLFIIAIHYHNKKAI
ncbi:CPBP family intramembrane glutamic endopeptidase [Thermolongibacillus altinsuensis]|uniref:CPBP family intramembrane glutamic endopeptidase n=1 Tax=Thermolongibacillus altinsuensis TaxID=575256 RepID=UPI00242A2D16|nr:CPBP family intramembrane glutamic endopeptidase [Thermolongibacillus altinsuensis]GMB08352.1 hypothetical protein B1no1_10620 [Thermolongibacillus altinsuensis]